MTSSTSPASTRRRQRHDHTGRGGLSGSLDDGSCRDPRRAARAAHGGAPLAEPPPADPYTETYTDRTDETGTVTYVNSFSAHIANGATVTVSGPATGPIAQTFTWKLAAAIDAGGAVRGSTYGLACVAVDQTQGGRTAHYQTTADVAGNFALQLSDVRVGDVVNVAAADQATHQTTTTALTFGGPTLKITGRRRPAVRARHDHTDGRRQRPRHACSGTASTRRRCRPCSPPAAPFPYPLDTTKFDDGTYRLEAAGRPDSTAYDYLYVTIDNTPPNGSAGADQTVARGSKAIIVTGAGDDTSGLASVKVDFGDKHRLTQSGDDLGSPVSHVYTKLGTFTAVVTITDAAGNVTSDSARIRVATTIAPQLGGNFPGKLVRKKSLAAKLVARQPGQLEIFILSEHRRAQADQARDLHEGGSDASRSRC